VSPSRLTLGASCSGRFLQKSGRRWGFPDPGGRRGHERVTESPLHLPSRRHLPSWRSRRLRAGFLRLTSVVAKNKGFGIAFCRIAHRIRPVTYDIAASASSRNVSNVDCGHRPECAKVGRLRPLPIFPKADVAS
jgi:hypothetical protein